MRRAALTVLILLTAPAAAATAPPDCASEVAALRQRLPAVSNDADRREASLLLDKADDDSKAGRERDCVDAVVRAQALVH
jgi:hypothetical protein